MHRYNLLLRSRWKELHVRPCKCSPGALERKKKLIFTTAEVYYESVQLYFRDAGACMHINSPLLSTNSKAHVYSPLVYACLCSVRLPVDVGP